MALERSSRLVDSVEEFQGTAKVPGLLNSDHKTARPVARNLTAFLQTVRLYICWEGGAEKVGWG